MLAVTTHWAKLLVTVNFPEPKNSVQILRLTKKHLICSHNSLFLFQMGPFKVNNSSRTCLSKLNMYTIQKSANRKVV